MATDQYQPRVVPAKRPIFGDHWPDPPAEIDLSEKRFHDSLHVEPDEPSELRARAIAGILERAGAAADELDWLRRYLRSISDRTHDKAIDQWITQLNSISEHWEREVSE